MNTTQKSLVSIVGVAAAGALCVLVPKYEGTKFNPYIDPVGIKTVCTGSITNVEDRTYTPDECSERLDGELASHADGAMNCLTKPTTPGQRVAYVSLTFNIGVTAFCRSTLVRMHNQGAGVAACAELTKWDKGMVGGKLIPLPGLTRRRAEEREYCEGRKKLSAVARHAHMASWSTACTTDARCSHFGRIARDATSENGNLTETNHGHQRQSRRIRAGRRRVHHARAGLA